MFQFLVNSNCGWFANLSIKVVASMQSNVMNCEDYDDCNDDDDVDDSENRKKNNI